MISDSPYKAGTPILSPIGGLIAGILATLAMLVFSAILQPLAGQSATALLARVGSLIPISDASNAQSGMPVVVGLGIYLVVGALLGLLYSVSQRRIPAPRLIGIGIFYGFLIWIVAGTIGGAVLGDALRGVLRTWHYLLACLLYGSCLALGGIVAQSQSPAQDKTIGPKD